MLMAPDLFSQSQNLLFFLFAATLATNGSSQAKGRIGAAAGAYSQNTRSLTH